jgi:hypothetical protein
MYQPYPGGTQEPDSARRSAPASVVRAAYVMYVGAAASLIGVIIDILTRGSIRSELRSRNHSLTAAQLTSMYHAVLGGVVVGGVIAIVLWIWMARMCKAGRPWARIVSTVLFAIQTINLAASAAVPAASTARIYGIVVWLIGLAAIVLLWQRPSSDYFGSTQRY